MPRKRKTAVPVELKAIGANIKKLRKSKEMTQEQFAERLSMNITAIQRLEEGADFKISTLRKLVETLGLETKDILGF